MKSKVMNYPKIVQMKRYLEHGEIDLLDMASEVIRMYNDGALAYDEAIIVIRELSRIRVRG